MCGAAVSTVGRWGGCFNEGRGKTVPNGIGVEGKHEFDGGAGKEGCYNCVDDTVDVVQG